LRQLVQKRNYAWPGRFGQVFIAREYFLVWGDVLRSNVWQILSLEPRSETEADAISMYPGTLQGLMKMIKEIDDTRGGEPGRSDPMPASDFLRNTEKTLAIILRNNCFMPDYEGYLEEQRLIFGDLDFGATKK